MLTRLLERLYQWWRARRAPPPPIESPPIVPPDNVVPFPEPEIRWKNGNV